MLFTDVPRRASPGHPHVKRALPGDGLPRAVLVFTNRFPYHAAGYHAVVQRAETAPASLAYGPHNSDFRHCFDPMALIFFMQMRISLIYKPEALA